MMSYAGLNKSSQKKYFYQSVRYRVNQVSGSNPVIYMGCRACISLGLHMFGSEFQASIKQNKRAITTFS